MQVWGFSLAFKGDRQGTDMRLRKYHLTQMPDHFFTARQDPIYCVSLLLWLDKQEPLYLEKNPIYLAIISGKDPNSYCKIALSEEKEFYDDKDIRRIFGFDAIALASDFIKKHEYGLTIDIGETGTWVVPKKIIDMELKLERVERGCTELERKIVRTVKIHAEKMKKIDEIDNSKTLMILKDVERYTLDIKLCQDDCQKGLAGACEFFDIRDNGGLRSSCILVRAHIRNIVDKVGKFIGPREGKEESFADAVTSQQFRAILNLEAKHKYMNLQQPYISTLWTKKTQHSEEDMFCSAELTGIIGDATLIKIWRTLGATPPSRGQEVTFGGVLTQSKNDE